MGKWEDFFSRIYIPFIEARDFARSLKLKKSSEWFAYVQRGMPCLPKLPDDIPKAPHKNYKDKGWDGMGDWLGTGSVHTKDMVFKKYKESRKIARELKLKSSEEWKKYLKGEMPWLPVIPEGVPRTPYHIYKGKGWCGWCDFLGIELEIKQWRMQGKFKLFEDARNFVRKLKLKSRDEWTLYKQGNLKNLPKMPDDIPREPWQVYKHTGWSGIRDWLGTEK